MLDDLEKISSILTIFSNYCFNDFLIMFLSNLTFFPASTEILMDMVAKIQKNPKVALVHQMPFTVDVKGVAGAVEKVMNNSLHYHYF